MAGAVATVSLMAVAVVVAVAMVMYTLVGEQFDVEK